MKPFEVVVRHVRQHRYQSDSDIFLLGQHTGINRHIEYCISAHQLWRLARRHWRLSRGYWRLSHGRWNTDIVTWRDIQGHHIIAWYFQILIAH